MSFFSLKLTGNECFYPIAVEHLKILDLEAIDSTKARPLVDHDGYTIGDIWHAEEHIYEIGLLYKHIRWFSKRRGICSDSQ